MVFFSFLQKFRLEEGSILINEDVRPVESERRTWTFHTFHNFWLLINCNIATFLTGSALIPLGLNWWQAIICIVIGNLLATGGLLLSSLAGSYYHIGFPVVSRAVWGIWGSQFTIWNRIFLSLGWNKVWYGFQSWVGGECIYLILLSWDPRFGDHIPNTFPADTGMTTAQFVSYVIFSIISLPFLWIKPHRLQPFFTVASVVTIVFFTVLLIWALATMGPGGFGDTISNAEALSFTGGPQSAAWLMVYGIMSTIGSIAAGILNQNDFARLARRPSDAILGQAFAYPVYGTFASVIGILVVAATQKRLDGEAVWNPPTLFIRLLERNPSAGTRASVFFAGLALVISQLGSSIPGNAVAGGIDLASVFPKYVNIRRGAYITAILSPIVNPWRLVNTATIFLSVLSSYGVFLAPMTGMMTAHYVLVSKGKMKVEDLYRGDKSSIYWYSGGINWRAPVTWVIGCAPCIPGFAAAVNTTLKVSDGAVELYYMNYLYGYLSSAVLFYVLHLVFPAQSLDAFVREPTTAKQLQRYYSEQLDSDVGYSVLLGEGASRVHSKETLSVALDKA